MTKSTDHSHIVTIFDALPLSEQKALRAIAYKDDVLFCEILGTMMRFAVAAKSGNTAAWKQLHTEAEEHMERVRTFLENSAKPHQESE